MELRLVDLAAELQVLSFHMARRAAGADAGTAEPEDDETVDDGPGGSARS